VFGGTLLLSGFLLFIVEPMFGKMVLPLLGGSPAVWNTCVLFFQAMLLLGYLYAHIGPRLLGWRRHGVFHLIALAWSILALPITLNRLSEPPTSSNPIPWLLLVLTISLGAPFLLLASTGPLLQAWFVRTRHRYATNPYFLYSASNAGSLAGLLSYPFLVEPSIPLGRQATLWGGGYLLVLALIVGCATVLWTRQPVHQKDESSSENLLQPTSFTRLRWTALAFVPSSLLLGLTTYVTMDLAAVPLLWVIPLAIYLVTLVLVFARTPPLRHRLVLRWQPLFVVVLLVLLFWGPYVATPALLPFHLAAFFLTGMACHGELAARRPPVADLTQYYLWIAFGGLLGGIFNVLIAPALFNWVLEYPLALVLGVALLPSRETRHESVGLVLLRAAACFTVLFSVRVLYLHFDRPGARVPWEVVVTAIVGSCLAAIVCYRERQSSLRLAAVLGAVVVAYVIAELNPSQTLLSQRDFFGIHRVREDLAGRSHILVNGTTVHGAQSTDPSRRSDPLSYYARSGPLGDVFSEIPRGTSSNVGVVGLGTGATAAYGLRDEHWTFFELDPAVEQIARDSTYFTYLRDSPADIRVVLGDGRRSLLRATDGAFRLLILDAFSSDAIPVHLLTQQALALYFSKLAREGVLVLHLSNRFIDLEPVLARLVTDDRLVARIRRFGSLSASQRDQGVEASTWAVVARDRGALGGLNSDPRWQALSGAAKAGLWTDDFSNVFQFVTIWGTR
jgi:hypothetical protein